jgi:hypothetical protein
MVRDSGWLAVIGSTDESDTWTANVEVPAEVGVPEMSPLGERVRPAGNDPEVIVQAYGETPPVAERGAV